MKKYVKIVMLILMLFIIFVGIAACSSNGAKEDDNQYQNETQISVEKKIIGEWELESQSYSDGRSSSWKLQKIKLYEDGTCFVNGEMGTWKIVDNELMVLGSYGGRFMNSDAIVGSFSCNDGALQFYEAQIDGKDTSVNLVYKRVK